MVIPAYNFSYGANGNNLPHVGLDGTAGSAITGGGPQLKVVSEIWSSTPVFPSVSLVGPTVVGPSMSFGIVFADVSSGPLTVGEWFELPYDTGTNPVFSLSTIRQIRKLYSMLDFSKPVRSMVWII